MLFIFVIIVFILPFDIGQYLEIIKNFSLRISILQLFQIKNIQYLCNNHTTLKIKLRLYFHFTIIIIIIIIILYYELLNPLQTFFLYYFIITVI